MEKISYRLVLGVMGCAMLAEKFCAQTKGERLMHVMHDAPIVIERCKVI
jgi:hypothetical protein